MCQSISGVVAVATGGPCYGLCYGLCFGLCYGGPGWRRGDRPRRSDPEAPCLDALAGTRRFSYPGWEKLENRSGGFFKGRRGETSQRRPLARLSPPGLRGGRRRRQPARRRPPSVPIHGMALVRLRFRNFSPPGGERGTSTTSVSSGALAPLAQPATVHLRRATELHASARHAPVLIFGLGKVGKSFGRVFQRKEGGDEPEATSGSAVTSRPPRRPATPPACPPKATLVPIHGMAPVPPGFWFFFPSYRGGGEKPSPPASSRALAGTRRPETVHLRRPPELHVPHQPDGGSWPLPP